MTPLRRRRLGIGNKALRALWNTVWLLLYRPSPVPLHAWRRGLLRLFGARVGHGAHPYPSARVWAPWNLTMGAHSCLSHGVVCYSVDRVVLGERVTVSQYTHLCTASHDFTRRDMPLTSAPIVVNDDAWITADVYVGPGVEIGAGAVVGARSTVVKDVEAWTVVAGNPARRVGTRRFVDDGAEAAQP